MVGHARVENDVRLGGAWVLVRVREHAPAACANVVGICRMCNRAHQGSGGTRLNLSPAHAKRQQDAMCSRVGVLVVMPSIAVRGRLPAQVQRQNCYRVVSGAKRRTGYVYHIVVACPRRRAPLQPALPYLKLAVYCIAWW